jgi:hypothetical protein
MSTVKEKLDRLNPEQRRQLMYAFEHGFAQFVEGDDGSYVGVHADRISHLRPEGVAGVWSFGRVGNG